MTTDEAAPPQPPTSDLLRCLQQHEQRQMALRDRCARQSSETTRQMEASRRQWQLYRQTLLAEIPVLFCPTTRRPHVNRAALSQRISLADRRIEALEQELQREAREGVARRWSIEVANVIRRVLVVEELRYADAHDRRKRRKLRPVDRATVDLDPALSVLIARIKEAHPAVDFAFGRPVEASASAAAAATVVRRAGKPRVERCLTERLLQLIADRPSWQRRLDARETNLIVAALLLGDDALLLTDNSDGDGDDDNDDDAQFGSCVLVSRSARCVVGYAGPRGYELFCRAVEQQFPCTELAERLSSTTATAAAAADRTEPSHRRRHRRRRGRSLGRRLPVVVPIEALEDYARAQLARRRRRQRDDDSDDSDDNDDSDSDSDGDGDGHRRRSSSRVPRRRRQQQQQQQKKGRLAVGDDAAASSLTVATQSDPIVGDDLRHRWTTVV